MSVSTVTGVVHVYPNDAEITKATQKTFFKELERLGTILGKKSVPSLLHEIHKDEKGLKCRFTATTDTSAIIVIVSAFNDSFLIKLAKAHGFPRGFPIVWIPDVKMVFFGFWPKFDNDDRKQIADTKEFDDTNKIHVTYKFSGFLGQVILWEHKGLIFHTYLSKNGFNTDKYCVDASRIGAVGFTDDVIQQMHKDNMYACGEVLSKNDQTHGAKVEDENIILTLIAKFLEIDLTENLASRDPTRFLQPLGHEEMVEYAVKNNLAVAPIYIVKKATEFAAKLSANRDQMTLTMFNKMMLDCECEVIHGTIDHRDYLGDTLEGLVMWLFKTVDGTDLTVTKKYKFPWYTHRTFGLRQSLSTNPKTLVTVAFLHDITDYVSRWVVADHQYWIDRLMTLALKHEELDYSEDPIGLHIRIADSFTEVTKDVENIFRARLNLPVIQDGVKAICIVIGPIGSGKTTRASQLGEFMTEKDVPVKVIDGDEFKSFTPEEVLKLGQERNPSTIWQVGEAIKNGEMPILSTGGGALIPFKKMFNLIRLIEQMLGIRCEIFTFITGDVDAVIESKNRRRILDIYETFNTTPVVKARLERGSWQLNGQKLSKFLVKISEGSKKNARFAGQIVNGSEKVFQVPIVKQGEHENPVDFSPCIKLLEYRPPTKVGVVNCMQSRLLCSVVEVEKKGKKEKKSFGHVTIQYGTSLEQFTTVDIDHISQLIGQSVEGTRVSHGKDWSFVAVPQFGEVIKKDEGRTHITVSSGKHAPVLMGTACLAWSNGKGNVSLATKDDKITYDLSKVSTSKVRVQVRDLIFM